MAQLIFKICVLLNICWNTDLIKNLTPIFVGYRRLQGHPWLHCEQTTGALPHGGRQDGGERRC